MFYAYARVSSAEQAAPDRVSLTEQIARCRAVATMRGVSNKWDVRDHVDRGVSGSVPLYKRPAGKLMLERVDQGDVICASKLDRIFRSASDALSTIARLQRKGVNLIICDIGIDPIDDSPTAKMFFSILAVVAQFERERIHERITEGKAAKKVRGGHIGGLVPFGFRKQGEGRVAMLVPDEREQQHIRRCRALYDEAPCSQREIAATMAAEGMLGRDGQPYTPMAIYRMVEKAQDARLSIG